MLTYVRKYWLTIKYVSLTAVLLAALSWLASNNVFDGLERNVNSMMDTLADFGLVGMFIIGLFSNMTLVVQIPYNLPMFTLIVYSNSLLYVLALGAATGLGGGIGEVVSYAVAHTLLRHVDDLSESALFRWTKNTIEKRPGAIPLFVWLASATPVPDLSIIVPLAMINYHWKKMIIPMITGKIFQNVVVALLFRFATERVSHRISRDVNFDLTAILVTIFVMTILYQVEKARNAAQQNGKSIAVTSPPPSDDTVVPDGHRS